MDSFDLGTVFIIGFLGSISHCIGMCGGFIFSFNLKLSQNEPGVRRNYYTRLMPQLKYHSGRILTYTIMGEIFGLIGSSLGLIFSVRGFQGGLQLLAGLVMVVLGLDLTGWIPKWQPDHFPGLDWYRKMVGGLFNRVSSQNVFSLGLILGLVPCGLVYSVAARAAASGSFLGGGLIMLVFGLGTLPALVLAGMLSARISQHWRGILYKIAAVLVMLFGVLTILRGIDALGWATFFWLVYI